MNNNLVQFGLSRLHVATIESAPANATPRYSAPVAWPGAVSISMNADTQENNFYADNRKYYGTFTDNGYSGELEMALLNPEIAVLVLGWVIDELGGLVEVANPYNKNFALLGQFEGDAHAARWAIYNCAAGKPSTDVSTTEATAEPQTQTLPYTATSIYMGDLLVTKYTLYDDPSNEEVHEAYTSWFDQVQLPILNTTRFVK